MNHIKKYSDKKLHELINLYSIDKSSVTDGVVVLLIKEILRLRKYEWMYKGLLK